jgi:hypothetical protein
MSPAFHETSWVTRTVTPSLSLPPLMGQDGWGDSQDHHSCWARQRGSEPLAGILPPPGRKSHVVVHPAYKYSQTAYP